MSSRDDDLHERVIRRLASIRTRLGERVFRAAARKALVGIGKAALAEGERRAASRDSFERNRITSSILDDVPKQDGEK